MPQRFRSSGVVFARHVRDALFHTLLACSLVGALSAMARLAAAGDSGASPRIIINLNTGWKFFAGDDPGAAEPGFDDSDWEVLTLPHTWNAHDGQDGGNDYRRGAGWYRWRGAVARRLAGRRLYLQFDGASLKADVFVNGRHLGTHVGGFARLRFDATALLTPGTANVIAVRVDNSRLGMAPTAADFTFFGGLYRGVSVLATDPVQISTMDHASAGVYLVQQWVSPERADVLCRTLVENHEALARAVEIRTTIFDQAGKSVLTHTVQAALAPGATPAIEQLLTLKRPRLWNGLADPFLYRVRVEVRVEGRVRDAVVQPLGLRAFHVDPQAGFFLNGRYLDLHGVNRHQDRLDKGWAINEADEVEDFALIQEVGANAIRVAHYQQSESWYDRCDRAGMVVWAEIPLVGEVFDTSEFIENTKQQFRELVRQNFNHPAIMFWGVGNETRSDAAAAKIIAQLVALVRQEDPTRLSTYASDHQPTDPRHWHTDTVAWNRYDGWYGTTKFSNLATFLDETHALRPAARLGLSEYGAGASIRQHQDDPPRRASTSKFHPEEYQNKFHEAAWTILQARPYVWGKFIWNMFDFAADYRDEGDYPGRNDKGLVTYDRKTRKDSFFFYKATWTNEPVLYITSRRFTPRPDTVTEVKVYANAPAVELFVNGVSQGLKQSANRVFRWPQTQLKPGVNWIEVRATIGGRLHTDRCDWLIDPDRAPPIPQP